MGFNTSLELTARLKTRLNHIHRRIAKKWSIIKDGVSSPLVPGVLTLYPQKSNNIATEHPGWTIKDSSVFLRDIEIVPQNTTSKPSKSFHDPS